MLAIFNKGLVHPPQELYSPASSSPAKNPKLPVEILNDFMSVNVNPSNAFSIEFQDSAWFAYIAPENHLPKNQRLFCGLQDLYCIFMGSLDNLSSLIRQYGLSKATNEAMLVIEAYRTLRDRGPYPAHQVLQDLEGSFGFVLYDAKEGHVFTALGGNEDMKLFWGIATDDRSVVISDKVEVIKGSCGKSFAAFPNGCMFHSEDGLKSFEHPKRKMQAMPRIDSEGVMCGANFMVDVNSRVGTMPRVGSEANWALRGSHA